MNCNIAATRNIKPPPAGVSHTVCAADHAQLAVHTVAIAKPVGNFGLTRFQPRFQPDLLTSADWGLRQLDTALQLQLAEHQG